MTDPIILAFDTAGPHCAVALLRDGQPLITLHEEMKRGQAERLVPLIEEVLAQAQISWSDIDLIAVGIGPGNFTGIRIGVSAARGMGLGLGVPVMGVSQFEIAYAGKSPVVIAGPRDIVYVQEFSANRPVNAPSITENQQISIAPPPAPKIAQVALARWQAGETQPERPAPLYVKAADAAPPRDPAPVILP